MTPPSITTDEAAQFAALYRTGMTMAEIGAVTGHGKGSVSVHLRRGGVRTRARGRRLRGWTIRE